MKLSAAPLSPREGARACQQTDAGSQIFTVRPNGHDLRQITHVDGDARMPDWSPDGRRIAFAIETEESSRIAIMNADGSDLVVLPSAAGVFEATRRSRPMATAS